MYAHTYVRKQPSNCKRHFGKKFADATENQSALADGIAQILRNSKWTALLRFHIAMVGRSDCVHSHKGVYEPTVFAFAWMKY